MIQFESMWYGAMGLLPHRDMRPSSAVSHSDLAIAAVTLVKPEPTERRVAAILNLIVVRGENTVLRRLFHVGLLDRLTPGDAPLRGSVPHSIWAPGRAYAKTVGQ